MRGAGARCRAERRAPGCPAAGLGRGDTAVCRGWQEKGCHPRGWPSPAGAPHRAAVGRERMRPDPAISPCLQPAGSVHLSAVGISGTCRALPVPPHQRLPPPACSPRLSPTTRGAFQPHRSQSPEIQPLSPVRSQAPHSSPSPRCAPSTTAAALGQVAAVIQALAARGGSATRMARA